MKRREPESVGDVLRELLEETSLQERMKELQAVSLWSRVVGAEINRECRKPIVKDGIMTIGLSNASLRHELSMSRTRLREIINNHLGTEIIKEIKFIS